MKQTLKASVYLLGFILIMPYYILNMVIASTIVRHRYGSGVYTKYYWDMCDIIIDSVPNTILGVFEACYYQTMVEAMDKVFEKIES